MIDNKITAKELFEQPFSATPQDFEFKPFSAKPKIEFGLFSEGSGVLIIFKPSDFIEACVFGRTEWADKRRWLVKFEKSGLKFQISASDFFKIFEV